MKQEKGVTLIALIITIIVMLILVVVTINIATTGQMVNKAVEAKTGTQAATANELNQMNTVADGITYATKERTIFDFTSSRSETYSNEEGDVNITKTYDNLYIHPAPIGDTRMTFYIIATVAEDIERQWDFDMDPSDNTFSIQTYKSSNINETGSGTIEIENYVYSREEHSITLGDTITLPAGWSHNNITAILTNYSITGIQEGSTITAIPYSSVPVFTNAKFITNKAPDESDGEPTFDSIKDLINNYLRDASWTEDEQNVPVNEIANEI